MDTFKSFLKFLVYFGFLPLTLIFFSLRGLSAVVAALLDTHEEKKS